MTITENETLDAMQDEGGSFASALAAAWRRADSVNKAKLMAAFGDLYRHYAEVASLRKSHRIATANNVSHTLEDHDKTSGDIRVLSMVKGEVHSPIPDAHGIKRCKQAAMNNLIRRPRGA